MHRLVYRDLKFDKQMSLLRKSGKKGALAAKEADGIIEKLVSGEPSEHVGVLTRLRDDRIDHCMKYDLGSGYRLVTCRAEDRLFVLYIGTHDECHRWLENNKGWRPECTENRGEPLPVVPTLSGDTDVPREEIETEGLTDYLEPIDEKYLRVVFRPLMGG